MKITKPLVTSLFIAGAMTFVTVPISHAQTADGSANSSTNQTARPKRGNATEQLIKRLDKELALSTDQKAKLKTILDEYLPKIREARKDSSGTPQETKTKVRALRDEEREKIKAVLTDEQKTKYDEMNKKRPRQTQN